jgi:folate-dependent phosphoribosylglycinamide formyltransferase PurN
MPSFLIVTTKNLPEAYFLADFLLKKNQPVAILNIRRRSLSQALRVAHRLLRNRGFLYILDLAVGKLLRSLFQSPTVVPFPEIDAGRVTSIQRQIRFAETDDPHGEMALGFVRGVAPDYLLLAGAPVLKASILNLARRETFNRHLGLAPGYRGSDCPLWAMRAGEFDQLGFTIQSVTNVVDGGPILIARTVVPPPHMDLSTYLAHLARVASEAFATLLSSLADGALVSGTPQRNGGRYYPPAGLSTLWSAHRHFAGFRRAAALHSTCSGR